MTALESTPYKGYFIEKVLRNGRMVYRVANSEGKHLINRPPFSLSKFEYGSLQKMATQLMLRKQGLFVNPDNKFINVSIVHKMSIEDCKQCIDDVIEGNYKL